MTEIRRRAYIYLTGLGELGLEAAVFRHPDFEAMTLGIQVPGGTIEPEETPEVGALREALEESGVDGFAAVPHLATDVRSYPTEVTERFFYQFRVHADVPDTRNHTVSDGKLDKGMVFEYSWLGVTEAKRVLSHMGDYLHLLS